MIRSHLRYVLQNFEKYPYNDLILWNSKGVRAYLGISLPEIYRLERQGIIPRIRRNGGRLEWTPEEVKEMIGRLIAYLTIKRFPRELEL